jgi:hypothetical protein
MRVTIPEDCKNINVLLSGGVDSTLLLFLLMKERRLTNNFVPIKCFVMNSPTTAYKHVLNWVSLYFEEEIPFQRMTRRFIRQAVENILLISPDGYVFTGCNVVVTDEFVPTVYLQGDTPPKRGPEYSERHLRPFIDVTKDVLIKEYETHGILDLFKLTVSCGVSDVPCGGCYFCMERQWGVEKAGIVL